MHAETASACVRRQRARERHALLDAQRALQEQFNGCSWDRRVRGESTLDRASRPLSYSMLHGRTYLPCTCSTCACEDEGCQRTVSGGATMMDERDFFRPGMCGRRWA